MERREFLKKAGLGSAAIGGLSALEVMSSTPAWAVSPGSGHGFFFQVVSHSTTSSDLVIISGCGRIANGVKGGGSFTHFIPADGPPFPIVATGHWRARTLLSFDPIGSYGELVAGIAEVEIVADITAPFTDRTGATLEIVCNIGPAGLVTGKEEGVTLSVPEAGLTFVPSSPPSGLTIFTTGFFGG
ncbi:MAG TPA: twin-arginine translocation signal domain-containing protein [Actinomycetota bacterium]|nr:twin-arginine translocation signal domain-containing protein [Actinomycetota bacterium]